MEYPKNEYESMTMNERLFASGRMNEFDDAVARRDRGRIVQIYKELAPSTDAEWAADSILSRSP
ncbi:MAG: hypothetical protein GXP06_14320 [Alphaproteobacteria bacterium]|nr:hypothetical protein [Alphaproteobacteria bacterium]